MIKNNYTVDTDGYKLTHHLQYPLEMTGIYSYAEARVGGKFKKTKFFGLQPTLIDYLEGVVVTPELIDEGEAMSADWFGTDKYFNRAMWEQIVARHGGMLPLEIKAVAEGSLVPEGNVLFTITNTDRSHLMLPLVNHAETQLMRMWYPTTIATVSHYLKKLVTLYAEKTGTPELVPFMVHDFGARGVSTQEQALYGGMAHLLSFAGSDTLIGDRGLRHYYGFNKLATVWATEHSVATSYGPNSGEKEYFKAQLERSDPNAIISTVADSYDVINFAKAVVGDPEMVTLIKDRPGRVVLRPDSGDPNTVVGQLLDILGNTFHYEYNTKGYKILKHNVGILQGDGMDIDSIESIYNSIIDNGWSSDNLVVGSGGGLLQKWNRDTQRFAIKASYGWRGETGFDIQKEVLSQPDKASKAGMLKLHPTGEDSYMTMTSNDMLFDNYVDAMEIVFKDGEVFPTVLKHD